MPNNPDVNPAPAVNGRVRLNNSSVATSAVPAGNTPACNLRATAVAGADVYALAAMLVGIDNNIFNGVYSMVRVAVPESPTIGLNACANRAASYIGVVFVPSIKPRGSLRVNADAKFNPDTFPDDGLTTPGLDLSVIRLR